MNTITRSARKSRIGNDNFVVHSMCNTKCKNYTAYTFQKGSFEARFPIKSFRKVVTRKKTLEPDWIPESTCNRSGQGGPDGHKRLAGQEPGTIPDRIGPGRDEDRTGFRTGPTRTYSVTQKQHPDRELYRETVLEWWIWRTETHSNPNSSMNMIPKWNLSARKCL